MPSMEFEVETRYTPRDMAAILRLQQRLRPEARPRLWQHPAVYGLLGCGLALYAGREDLGHPVPWITAGVCLAVALMFLPVTQRPRTWLAARVLWLGYEGKGQTLRFRFRRRDYQVQDRDRLHPCQYRQLKAVFEDGARFYLVTDESGVQLLPKADFVAGDPRGFRDFLGQLDPPIPIQAL